MEVKKHHRGHKTIQRIASSLELTKQRNDWSAEEINILKTYYPTEGMSIQNRLPNRTKKDCQIKANKLELKVQTVEWTKDDISYLYNNYAKLGPLQIAKVLRKTQRQCSKKGKELGLRYDDSNRHATVTKKIVCLELKITYNTITEAEMAIGVKGINVAIKKNQKCGGYHWKYLEDYLVDNTIKVKPHGLSKAVRCIETGEIFSSTTEAQKKYPGHLTDHLKGKRPSSGKLPDGTKLHWEYVKEENNK